MGGGVLLLFGDVVEELPARAVLHDEEEVLGGLDDFVELDEVGVADEFEDVYFAGDALDVRHVHDLLLLQHLHCHLLARPLVDRQLYLPERALAQRLL